MQINIDSKYPHGLSDEELSRALHEYAGEMSKRGLGNPNYIPYYAPLIQLGLAERDARRNKSTTRRTLGVAAISLIVSGVALFVAMSSNRSNTDLDEREIAAIERLMDVLNDDDKISHGGPKP